LIKLLTFFISVYIPTALEGNGHMQPLYFRISGGEALHGGPIGFEECGHIRLGIEVHIAEFVKGEVGDFGEAGIHPLLEYGYFLGGVSVVIGGEVGKARLYEGGSVLAADNAEGRQGALQAFEHIIADGVMAEENAYRGEGLGLRRGSR